MPPAKPTAFIDFDIVGDIAGVQAMLNQIDSALSPAGLALFLFGPVQHWVKSRSAARFGSEGDDVTGGWAPLKVSTIEIREHQGFGAGPINRRTGELERYITQSTGAITSVPGMSTFVYPGDAAESHLATKVATAQKGKVSPLTKPRPVLGMNERDLASIMTSLAFHVKTYQGGRL